jgi:hypothetical protein
MRLLISTPCSGGMLYLGYVDSLIQTISRAMSEGLVTGFQFHFQGKESLIHRARDKAAMFMVENGFDKLLTVDADITWTYEDFKRIVTSDKDIVGGSYPLKTFPIVVNFNPLPEKGGELFKTGRGFDYDAFALFKEKYADPTTGLAEVMHLPTGFLCVTRRVFEKLGETSQPYENFDSATGQRKRFMHFYESGVHEGVLESEDWNFSRRSREVGFPVYFDTRVVCTHTGNHAYSLGQFFGETQAKKS